MSNTSEITLTIEGQPVDFVRKDSIPEAVKPSGPLSIVVLHRGWMFVGRWDGESGVISQCENIRSFKSVGFGGLTQGARTAGAKLDKCRDVTVDPSAYMFHVPVAEGWHDA